MNELEKLLAEATPGTWSVTEDGDIRCEQIVTEDGETYTESCSIATGQCSQNWGYIHWGKLEDAALICAAVNALPELLAKVKRLEEALAFYADPANHIGYPDPNAKVYIETSAIDRDGGNRARALIAGVAIEDRFVQIGWTNEVQIGYVTTDGEGAFYPDSEHDCNVPVYRARAALNQETKP